MFPAYLEVVEKRPFAALRCNLSHCGVQNSTSHSFGLARLASEHFEQPQKFFE